MVWEAKAMQFMDVVYLILWALLGAYCFYAARKLSPILYILGIFFVFMFGWYLANDLLAVDLFGGTYNLIFRGIALCFLVLFLILYLYVKKHPKDE